ncbi:divergent PAP2 family protein [Cohnella sp. 56]|uniref:divergent PAP2 family protein n=1 Tax=Cohnella sp. 56 TaxID=3113722 RepID=UPI0030E8CDA4
MYYFIAPMVGWLTSGVLKFAINYFRFGKKAKEKIGNGGFPSTHTTIVVTTVSCIGFQEGIESPGFGLGVAFAFIVIIDAMGLRRAVGKHAAHLNKLNGDIVYRESMGHNKYEVFGGICLGIILGAISKFLLGDL